MNKLWSKITGKSVENSIYMKVLKLGYESDNEGISFNEVVEKLNIDISNEVFELNFAVWFYSNFYNTRFEPKILGMSSASNPAYYLSSGVYRSLRSFNADKSYLKGDSLNKYIDFLELQRTRKASINATIISLISVVIALGSIIIPRIFPDSKKPSQNTYKFYYDDDASINKNNDTLNIESTVKDMEKNEGNSKN